MKHTDRQKKQPHDVDEAGMEGMFQMETVPSAAG